LNRIKAIFTFSPTSHDTQCRGCSAKSPGKKAGFISIFNYGYNPAGQGPFSAAPAGAEKPDTGPENAPTDRRKSSYAAPAATNHERCSAFSTVTAELSQDQ
jgi:hypothetical protein